VSPERPGQPGRPDDSDQPTQPTQPDQAERLAEHDETGLDLARSVARALAGSGRRRGRTTGRRSRRVDPQASGAHPDDRDPQLLDTTIGRLISDQGWDTDVRVHGVFTRWEVVVGRDVAQHCRPESFAQGGQGDDRSGGKLVVRTDSTAWATQMRLLAPTVVRRLNEELGDGTVTVIDVLGPQAPSWKRGPRSVRDGRGPRDTYG